MADDDHKYIEIMEAVARRLLSESGEGEPNPKMSKPGRELRWGDKGGFAVDLIKGTWFDHVDASGGGVIDLVKAFKGLGQNDAVQWLVDEGYLAERDRDDKPKEIVVPGGFPDFFDNKPIAVYEYYDTKNALAYQVLKFPKEAQTRFMQRRPYIGNTWVWGLTAGEWGKGKKSKDYFRTKEGKTYDDVIHVEDAPRFLYRRSEVIRQKKNGGLVLLCEGEKDVETLRAWGYVATTNAGGAKYWDDSFDTDLSGCDVVILPDNDDVGRDRAVIRSANLKGKAKRIRVLDLSLHWKDAQPKEDVTDWKEKTRATKERFEALLKFAVEPDRPKSKFGAIGFHDVKLESKSDYLVHKLLTFGDTSIIGGATGAGKTFFTMHLGFCIARGQPFLGHPTVRHGVAYQAGEGGHGAKKRIIAYKNHFAVPDDEPVPFFIIPRRIDLYSKDGDTAAFVEDLKLMQLEMDVPLGLVVIDTFNKASAGAEETSGKDIGIVLRNVDKIRQGLGVHVCIVHHMNAAGEKLRGHSSLGADVDEVLLLTNDEETKVKTCIVHKLKDDEAGEEIRFTLAQVKVDTDQETGDDITSCVVLTQSDKEKLHKGRERHGHPVNAAEKKFLVQFFAARKKYGVQVYDEPGFPSGARGKTVITWAEYKEYALSQMPDEDDVKKATDRIRKEFDNRKQGLIKAGLIGLEKPYLWWTGKPVQGFPDTFPRKNVDSQAQVSMLDPTLAGEADAFLQSEKDIPF